MRIDEIIDHGGDGDTIVYYRGQSWRFNRFEEIDLEKESHLKFKKVIQSYIQQFDEYFEIEEDMDIQDIIEVVNENDAAEIIVFEIENNHLVLDSGAYLNFRPSIGNKNILKLLDHYDLEGVKYYYEHYVGDQYVFEVSESRDEFLKPLKDKTFYHGTNSVFLKNILRKGILSHGNYSNFEKIKHDTTVFITLNKEKAIFHAIQSAEQRSAVPVIIEFKVPDESKLVLDYDVAIQLYGKDYPLTTKLGYDEVHDLATGSIGPEIFAGIRHNVDKNFVDQVSDKSSLNTKIGIFGYKGRIAPSHFTGLYYNTDSLAKWILLKDYDIDLESDDEFVKDFKKATKHSPSDYLEDLRDAEQEVEDELMPDEDDEMM